MKALPRLILLLCLLLALPGILSAALISGKASVAEKAAPDTTVVAYPANTLNFQGPAPYHSSPTQTDGRFTLDVPEGQYYLMAQGDGLFSYYGRNPVSVSQEGLESVNLLLLPDDLPGPEEGAQGDTGIVGRVTLDGHPVKEALVTVYPDLSSQLKGMGLAMSAPTDSQGIFGLDLPAGTYYLVVRVRRSGMMAGPLKAGDLFGYLPGNPVALADGEVARVHIPLLEVPEKVERHAATLFGNTRITGRIVDVQGEPVSGVQALLYDDSAMLNRPLYVSQKTDTTGSFVLSFPQGGLYYLAARSELGGTPAPGEFYGRYQGSPDHALSIASGKTVEGVVIVVEEVY